MNHASPIKNTVRKSIRILITLAVFAGVLSVTASGRDPSTATSDPAASAAAAELNTLLNEGNSVTTNGYFQATSASLVAASVGQLNSSFYDLGKLLVNDGLSNTIIELSPSLTSNLPRS